jgi:hypothetical protein
VTTFFLNDIRKIIWHGLWFSVKKIGNILKIFVISCTKIFKLIFLESPAESIENLTFYFIQICPRFVSPLLFILWIIFFATKLRFGRNPSKPFFIKNKKKIISPKFAKLISRPIHHVKFISLNLWKKSSFDVLKFRIVSSFFKNLNFDFDVGIV